MRLYGVLQASGSAGVKARIDASGRPVGVIGLTAAEAQVVDPNLGWGVRRLERELESPNAVEQAFTVDELSCEQRALSLLLSVQAFRAEDTPEAREALLLGVQQSATAPRGIWEVNNAVTRLAFSPDGRVLASGSDMGTVRLWDVDTGRSLTSDSLVQSSAVSSLAFSPSGRLLATGGDDGTVQLI